MYDKRPAWCLAAAAPRGGSLRDVVAAAMTELPTTKQGARRPAERHAREGRGRRTGRPARRSPRRARRCSRRPRSTSSTASPGWRSSSSPGKLALAELETELFTRLGSRDVFDDEYISSGGQLHELIAGHDRFVADLRPLVDPDAFACHPYDVCTAMLLEELVASSPIRTARRSTSPLDTTTAGGVGRVRQPGARRPHRPDPGRARR